MQTTSITVRSLYQEQSICPNGIPIAKSIGYGIQPVMTFGRELNQHVAQELV